MQADLKVFSSFKSPFSHIVYVLQATDLQQTALHNLHMSHGGQMVPFAGWSMPVVYSDLTIKKSVIHTREQASLFDVSHMLQVRQMITEYDLYLALH